MKIFHLSDLHIGKQLNGYSLKENQEAVLCRIAEAAREERPDVILICGDIYDKTVPSGEAFRMFSDFLEQLGEIRPQIPVLIISGNHDSPDRLRFASSFLEKHKIYISVLPPQRKEEYLKKITLEDEYGPVHFYMLPFMKPGFVRPLIEEEEKAEEREPEDGRKNLDYEEAVRAILNRETIDFKERNVLLSHQFYVFGGKKPEICDSEVTVAVVGGLDSIDIQAVEAFDYVALGHIHGAQPVGKEHIRYCGSPFKYSVSEEHHKKGVTQIILGKKGDPITISQIPLLGLQDVRRETGSLEEVLDRAAGEKGHDFVSIILTDEMENYNFREKLEEVYDHILEIKMDNARIRKRLEEDQQAEEAAELSPLEAFEEFYQTIRGCSMTEEEKKIVEEIEIWAEREVD